MVLSGVTRVTLLRALALLCACSLSIGGHFGLNLLGPLKSQLLREKGTSNAQFGLLISASALNSTWTPLVGGLLTARLGTALSSIVATSIILTGQVVLLIGDLWGSVRLMVLGMFIFGLGISPIAVVQETIIVRYFKDHGLGLSLALGLVAGKTASFISARISFPLSQWNQHAPFFLSTFLAGFSFLVNLFYLWYNNWLASQLDSEGEGVDAMSETDALHKVTTKKKVRLKDLLSMGDVFWLYIGVNIFCGFIWMPFPPLAPNVIQNRFRLDEGRAAEESSILLAGSIFLYPICGYITDVIKKRSIVHKLLLLSSILTMFCYGWLALPPSFTGSPLPAMISFGLGIGFSPLLLVIIVPHLVPLQYVSTALGAHKSIESSGSVTMQTVAGYILDTKSHTSDSSIQKVLNTFLTLNIIQFVGVYLLMLFDRARKRRLLKQVRAPAEEYEALTANEEQPEHEPSPDESHELHAVGENHSSRALDAPELVVTPAERSRGKVFFIMSACTIFATWILFFASAGLELRGSK